MLQCWEEETEKRGTFSELQEKLLALAKNLPDMGVERDKASTLAPSSLSTSTLPPDMAAVDEGEVVTEYLKEADKNTETGLYTDQV